MKISTKARYSLRAMQELARRRHEGPLSSATISRAQGIPVPFLQNLLARLRRADLVKVTMGPGGGFSLALPPEAINLEEILDAAGERLELVPCALGESRCPRSSGCAASDIWAHGTALLRQYFRSVTLAQTLARQVPPAARAAPPSRSPRNRRRRTATMQSK